VGVRALERVGWAVLRGVVYGLLYYAIYLLAAPSLVGIAPQREGWEYLYGLYVLLALSIAQELLEHHPASIPLRALVKVAAVALFVSAVGGGRVEVSYQGVSGYIDASPLVAVVAAATLAYAVLDVALAAASLREKPSL
jgi:hypothetical protein